MATTGTPFEDILLGESLEHLIEPFEKAMSAVTGLGTALTSVDSEVQPSDVSWRHHADNLVVGLGALLNEEVAFPRPGTEDTYRLHLGQLVRPYDLDFLKKAAERTSAELLAERPSPANLELLTFYLQAWVDFIVPSALGDLEVLGGSNDRITSSPRIQSMLRDNERLRRIGSLERQAESAVHNIKVAAGEGGKERLAQTFDARGKAEDASASNWNKLVMLFVSLGMGLPLLAISLDQHFLGQLPGTYGVVIKALIGLPMFALATYSGRISAQHRRMAQHMKTLTAQIDSVKAYVATLPQQTQQDIIAALGRRAFSEPGVASSEGTVGLPPEQILPTMEKLVEAVKNVRG
ncbi:hypothetical protein ACNQVK_16850 [Mycobacterium sp. 134]|uniref:hypothetical protein n=1 Tax=Mycobacterium sp. 134 TaxID=3400425 RepID=UPI003AB058DD